MKFEETLKHIKQGKTIVGEKQSDGYRYYLFIYEDELYFIRDKTINEDKKELSITDIIINSQEIK